MSILIGTNNVSAKNIRVVNEALDTVEQSALLGSSENANRSTVDQLGNIYVGSGGGTTPSVAKYNASLVLDTTWATNGVFQDSSATQFFTGLMAALDGKIFVAGVSSRYYLDTSGSIVWQEDATGVEAFCTAGIDYNDDGVWSYQYGVPFEFLKKSATDGSTLLTADAAVGTGNSAGGAVIIDRINSGVWADSAVPQMYFHFVHNTVGYIRAYNANTGATIWTNTTSVPVPITGQSTLALDSTGNLYLTGTRIGTKTVWKINPATGASTATYDTGGTGQCIVIDGSDRIYVGHTASSSKILTELDTTLAAEVRSLSTATVNATGVFAVQAGLVATTVTSPPVDKKYSKKLVAIANGQVWQESTAGTMSALSVATGVASGLNTSVALQAFEGFQKVFVSNNSVLNVADFGNTKLLTSNIGSNEVTRSMILQGGSSSAAMVVDYVQGSTGTDRQIFGTRTTVATFVSTETITDSGTASVSFTVSVAEVAPPHYYGWRDFNVAASLTTLPDKATLGCLYRGRAVLSGNPGAAFQWYMSRQNNPWDWTYLANDAQAPVAGSNADAGELGDTITCLIPYKDDYLVIGCTNTIWVLRGDPAAGGSLDEVSLTTGIFGPYSWAWDNADNLYFFGTDGVYRIPPGFGPPENLSATNLPNLIADEAVAPDTHRITMGYDRIKKGILVCITTLATGANSCYWYDLRTQGFFPESYPNMQGVFSSHYYEADDPNYRKLLLGCADSGIRHFDTSKKYDESFGGTEYIPSRTGISSNVLLGPVVISDSPDGRGRLTSLTIVTGTNTDSLSYEIYVKNSAEEILDDIDAGTAAHVTGTVQVDNRVARIRARARGIYCAVRLLNVTNEQGWALETVNGVVVAAGRS